MAGVLLALGALVAACSDDRERGADTTPAASDHPIGSGSPSTPPTASGNPSTEPPLAVTGGGTGGLTIRYLDADGKIKTVRVENFPR
jgi:hypothetical protein